MTIFIGLDVSFRKRREWPPFLEYLQLREFLIIYEHVTYAV